MSDTIPNRQNWTFDYRKDVSFDKKTIQDIYIKRFLIMLSKMFKYENLPKTIPQKDLELLLLIQGHATITKVNNELYAFYGQLGGIPNEYYLPTLSIVANPFLKFNKQLVIDKDCVVMLNDSLYEGLFTLINHTSNLLAECDISFKFASINSRVPTLVVAPNDNSYKSLKSAIDKIIDGSDLAIFTTTPDLFAEAKGIDYAKSNDVITDLIEMKQYILGSFLQSIGIKANFNMKREAINEAEASMNEDILYPTVDDMLDMRKQAIEKINNMYGTNISVEFSSVWKKLRKQESLSFNLQKSEISKNLSENNENNESEENDNE